MKLRIIRANGQRLAKSDKVVVKSVDLKIRDTSNGKEWTFKPTYEVADLAAECKWGSGLLKSRLCFLTSKNHKQDYKQRGTTTWG